MGIAFAHVEDGRIVVRTQASNDFEFLLAACKRVRGGRFANSNNDPRWHYALSLSICHALRTHFGDALRVSTALADWYRLHAAEATEQIRLASASDAPLPRLSAAYPQFAAWLRGYQRAGAQWVERGYRGCGINADKPGLGKTSETLAGLIEMGVTGPVLVICPKSSVRLVWGAELDQHLPDVPAYLCYGSRAKRDATIKRFANDVHKEPDKLRVVVIVAEMLRVELGDPCYTVQEVIGDDGLRRDSVPANKVAGMCPQRMKNMNMECTIHIQQPVEHKKDRVPVDFSYRALFDQHLLRGGWGAIIIDESQKLLGSLTVVQGNLMGKGLRYLPERTGRRYALSGTPFGKAGRVEGLFGTLRWLWPDEYTSYWKWVDESFEVEEKVVDRRRLRVKKIVGLRGLSRNASDGEKEKAWEEFLRTLGPRLLRRTKEETLKWLPPKIIQEVRCGMSKEQHRQYRELLRDAEIKTPGGLIMPNGALALLTRSRQIANGQIELRDDGSVGFTGSSGKITRLWEKLETRGILDDAPGAKVIVASVYNQFLDAVAARLRTDGVGFFQFDGRVPEGRRNTMVELWQANQPAPNLVWTRHNAVDGRVPRVMLVNIQAGGLSITLDSADEVHMLDEDPDPGINEQMEDRVHRASRAHQVFIYYYRTEGTIDYERAHNVEMKRRAQHAVLDGARGIDYVREMLSDAFTDTESEE